VQLILSWSCRLPVSCVSSRCQRNVRRPQRSWLRLCGPAGNFLAQRSVLPGRYLWRAQRRAVSALAVDLPDSPCPQHGDCLRSQASPDPWSLAGTVGDGPLWAAVAGTRGATAAPGCDRGGRHRASQRAVCQSLRLPADFPGRSVAGSAELGRAARDRRARRSCAQHSQPGGHAPGAHCGTGC
jgi:hypothetical protein